VSQWADEQSIYDIRQARPRRGRGFLAILSSFSGLTDSAARDGSPIRTGWDVAVCKLRFFFCGGQGRTQSCRHATITSDG